MSVPRVVQDATPATTQLPPTREPTVAPAPVTDGRTSPVTAFDIPLRITALLPDPIEPGPDARYEWIELTNVGRSPLRLGGFELRDNTSALTLPDVELPARSSIVVAGVEAEVGEVIAIRLDSGLFNGLANAGDRVLLLTREGAIVDALSYGDDASSYGPPLAAPGAGELLRRHFAADGTLVGIEIDPGDAGSDGDRVAEATAVPAAADEADAPPTPALAVATEAPPSSDASTPAATATEASPPSDASTPAATATEAAPDQGAASDGGGGANRAAWIALASIALGALGGVGAFRLRELLTV